MIDSIPVRPHGTVVIEPHPIDRKALLKRARKLKIKDMSATEARKDFTEYEIRWLKAYYLVEGEGVRRAARRRGWGVELPRLLKE